MLRKHIARSIAHIYCKGRKMAACISVIACFVIIGRLQYFIMAVSQEKNVWRIWISRVRPTGMWHRAVLYKFNDFPGVLTDSVFIYKVDKTDLSGMSVNFYQTTWRHPPENCVLYIHHFEVVVFCKSEYSAIKHVPFGFRDKRISIADL